MIRQLTDKFIFKPQASTSYGFLSSTSMVNDWCASAQSSTLRRTTILYTNARVMLPGNHGAYTVRKSLRRPIMKNIASFIGKSNLASVEAMGSAIAGMSGKRARYVWNYVLSFMYS